MINIKSEKVPVDKVLLLKKREEDLRLMVMIELVVLSGQIDGVKERNRKYVMNQPTLKNWIVKKKRMVKAP